MGGAQNRCMYCGRFIGYDEFINESAVNKLLTPDAYGVEEVWETYHTECEAKEVAKCGSRSAPEQEPEKPASAEAPNATQ